VQSPRIKDDKITFAAVRIVVINKREEEEISDTKEDDVVSLFF